MITRPFAVLMGDLVDSERNGIAKDMHRRLNATVAWANDATRPVSPLTITLGDEFQGLFASLVTAARTARAMRFDLLDHDIECRFAIGITRLETEINTERAWNMMGPGLAETRARLGEKRPTTLYRFVLPDDRVVETLLEASGASLTMIERNWTATQRRHVIASLEGTSVIEIGRAANVSAHNVYKVRSAGRFELYRQQWAAVETALGALDHTHGLRAWE